MERGTVTGSSNPASLSAATVAAPIAPFLQPSLNATILASFDHSCYLETSTGGLIAVLGPALDRSPFALTVAGDSTFAHLRPEHLVRCDGRLLSVGSLSIDLSPAESWDPTVPALTGSAERSMAALKAWLQWTAPEDGLARALDARHDNALLKEARAGINTLKSGLQRGSETRIQDGTVRLAGLGPGLTPSGDDVLAGILLALHLWPDIAGKLGPQAVSGLIVETASPRTGKISRAYLEAARRGQASWAWHELIRLLPVGRHKAVDAAAPIFQAGETSGADMLAGFVFAHGLRPRSRIGRPKQRRSTAG